jgi:hypothetical protein
LAVDEIACQRRKLIVLVLRPAIFDRHVLSLNIADLSETSPDTFHALGISFERSYGKESDHRHIGCCARGEGPRRRRTAEERDEIPPVHGEHGTSSLR